MKFTFHLPDETVLKYLIEDVEAIRKESEVKLKKSISYLGKDKAAEVATYFFGSNPEIENLTKTLLKDLKIIP